MSVDTKRTLKPFNYQNVRLEDSLFKRQFDETMEYYLAIPNDSLLYPFREKAGLPAPGKPLTGWYGTGTTTFGQKLGAFAKMFSSCGDARLREKALFLAEEWGKCADKTPAVLSYGTYAYEKLLGGFLDMFEYLGYSRGLEFVSKLTDQAIVNFKRDIKRDGLQDSGLTGPNMIEWYTLPENLFRAYELTNDRKYLEFAEEWEYDYYWDKLRNDDPNIGPRHAYSHVNTLSSAARAYQVKHDERYLQTIMKGYDFITSKHTFATGGYGPAECLFTERDGYLGDSLKSTWDPTLGDPTYRNFGGGRVTRDDTWGSCEVPCCTWAVFKICNYLFRFTGAAKYGAWVEKLLYNGTGAELPVAPGGKIMYYTNYFVNGAVKTVEDRRLFPTGENFHWQCCTGTFPQDVAEYCNLIYYYDEEGIYVSQYVPSQATWHKNGASINVQCFTAYPEEESARFIVRMDKEMSFAFNFRIPSWVEGVVSAKVNGEDVRIDAVPGTWGSIRRVWKDGDVVTVTIPFSLRFESVDEKNRDIVALSYGPIVLVTNEMAQFVGDTNKPETWIHPVEGQPLTFETEKGHVAPYDFVTRVFRPFYAVNAMEWYFMYNRIKT